MAVYGLQETVGQVVAPAAENCVAVQKTTARMIRVLAWYVKYGTCCGQIYGFFALKPKLEQCLIQFVCV
jgi:hypothetical protein